MPEIKPSDQPIAHELTGQVASRTELKSQHSVPETPAVDAPEKKSRPSFSAYPSFVRLRDG